MPDRIIEAEALITAKDATGDVFARVAQKIQGVGKSAAVSKDIDRMSQSLERAGSQMRALDKFQAGSTGLAGARAKFNAAKTAVEQAARAMREAETPTRQMEADFKRLQTAVSRAAAEMEKQKTAAVDAKHALEGFGMPLGHVAEQQARLRGVIASTTKAIQEQAAADQHASIAAEKAHASAEKLAERRAHLADHHGLARTLLNAGAGAVGVHTVLHVGEVAWEAGAERQHVVTGMLSAGMKQDEINRAQTLAQSVAHQAPNMSVSEIMELHKEARSAVQHPEEVFDLMPDLARAASVLKGMGAENANIADLVKGGESLGLMNDPARFHRFLDGQVKAMQVMGKTITTEQIYEAAKYSKATGSTLSDEFLNLTMPSLIQEMHGSSAGDALSALSKRLRGGLVHQHLAVDEMNKMGLLDDPSQIKRSKTGEIIGYSGKVKGDSLLTSDPGKWFQTFFKDGAARVGATSLEDINKLLAETLPSTAANLGRILIQQEETLKQHRANYEGATDLEETVRNQREDWSAATQAFKASLADLGASVTGVNMGRAAHGLSWLADKIKSFSQLAAEHPYIAVPTAAAVGGGALLGSGYLAAQFLTAGTSLQTAATMLQEAAVKQGAAPTGGVLKGAGGAAAGEIVEGGALASGAIGTAAGVGVAGTLAGLMWLIQQSAEAQKAGHGGAWAPATFETRDQDEDALGEQKDRLAELQARADRTRAASKFPDMPNPVLQQLEDEIADLRNQIDQREASLAKVPKFPIGPRSDGNAPTMLGYDGVTLPNVPLSSIGRNTLIGAPNPSTGPDLGKPEGDAHPLKVEVLLKKDDIPTSGPLPPHIDPNREEFGPYIPGKLGHEMFGPVMPHPQIAPAPEPPPPSNAIGSGHYTFGRGGFRQWVPGPGGDVGNPGSGPIDVTGKVSADVNAKVSTDVNVHISGLPTGVSAETTFKSTSTKVSTGPTMPHAGQTGIAHPAGRGD